MSSPGSIRAPWAHPRSRGENRTFGRFDEVAKGSSPLTRGKRSPHPQNKNRTRLIPAHAGKTGTMPGAGPSLWAHPRSRGENLRLAEEGMDVLGSSPLTRGKLRGGPGRPETQGLIPAHAGKTLDRDRLLTATKAHPRSRGENRAVMSTCVCCAGSSPLTRGKQ